MDEPAQKTKTTAAEEGQTKSSYEKSLNIQMLPTFRKEKTPMTIKRVKRRSHFTIVNNQIINDSNLSMKARGLLVYMLSKPDDWIFYETEMVKAGPDGRDSIRTAIKEIEQAGYLEREQAKRGEDGKFAGKNWLLHDEPMTENPSTENPRTDKPTTDKPTTENPTLVSTDSTKNLINQELNKPNTDNNNYKDQQPLPPDQPKETNFIREWEKAGFGVISGFMIETLDHWIKDFEGQEAVIIKAIHEAAASNPGAPLKYVEGILKKWQRKGIKIASDVDAEQAKYQKQKEKTNSSYNSHARQESLPEWARDDAEEVKDTPLSPEKQAEHEERMRKWKERREKLKKQNT